MPPSVRFGFCRLLADAQRTLGDRGEGAELGLPFLSVSVCLDDAERRVARQIASRIADRHFLSRG